MPHTVFGIILLVWANLYDSADGQLARMTGKKTLLGRVLDGFAGDYHALSWRKDWFHKTYLYFYGNYTRAQERQTPMFQRFYAAVRKRFGDNLPQALRDDFRRGSLPLMKYANILTFNTRAIVLYVVLLVGQPWLYFVFEITVMTIIYLYMRSRHERLCFKLFKRLNQYEPEAA